MAEQRASFKKGRTTAKGQVYRVGHNDRQENLTANAKHIDHEKSQNNIYMVFDNNVQKFLTLDTSLEEYEKAMYTEWFSATIDDINTRAIRSRHKERLTSVPNFYEQKNTCPEETILQIDKDGLFQDVEGFNKVIQEFIKWQSDNFPDIRVLDYAIHTDETSLHAHLRQVYTYTENGLLKVGQHKCLEKSGFQLPDPEKPRGQFNNLKIPFTDITREAFYNVIEDVLGIEINRSVISPSQRQKNKLEAFCEATEAYVNDLREYAEKNEKIVVKYKIAQEREQTKKLKHENKLLQLDVKQKKNSIKLKSMNYELIEQLETSKKQLTKEWDELSRARNSLNEEKKEIEKVKKENVLLVNENTLLKNENTAVKKENAMLAEYKSLVSKKEQLAQEVNSQLEVLENCKTAKSEYQILQKEFSDIKKQVAILDKERFNLMCQISEGIRVPHELLQELLQKRNKSIESPDLTRFLDGFESFQQIKRQHHKHL